jgi:hypothetical protein
LDANGNTRIELNNNGTATIGGWTIGTSSLSYENSDPTYKNDDNTRWLYFGTTNSATLTWNNNEKKYVALRLGNGFGVTTAGKLYASGAEIDGKITLSAGSKMNGNDIGEYSTFAVTKTSITTSVKETYIDPLDDKVTQHSATLKT